jgi:HlyD family secretion protein
MIPFPLSHFHFFFVPFVEETFGSRSTASLLRCVFLFGLTALAGCNTNGNSPSAVGTIERDRIELIAEAQEPIVEIVAREGQRVKAGDVVLKLDEQRLDAEVMRAEGARDRAMARLAELERGPRHERIDEAKAAVAGAQGVLDRDRRELERAKSLSARGVASQADLDAARARYDDSLARRDRAVAELDALVTGTTAEELDQARAAVTEAQGALQEIRIRHDRLTVQAPVNGVIDTIPFKLGDRPPAGAAVAVMLTDGAPYARVYVPEALRVRVKPGVEAKVRIDGVPQPFVGRVRMVSGEATFTPFFALTEKDRGRLAYLAEVDLIEARARDLPTGIPAEAQFDINGESEEPADA